MKIFLSTFIPMLSAEIKNSAKKYGHLRYLQLCFSQSIFWAWDFFHGFLWYLTINIKSILVHEDFCIKNYSHTWCSNENYLKEILLPRPFPDVFLWPVFFSIVHSPCFFFVSAHKNVINYSVNKRCIPLLGVAIKNT